MALRPGQSARIKPPLSAARMIRLDRADARARLSGRARRHFSQRRLSGRRRRAGRSPTISSHVRRGPATARDGNPAAAYDWPIHKQAEVSAIGHDFDDYYGWHYPPTFLFVAAALATLPYLAAAIGLACCDARRLCRGAWPAFSAAPEFLSRSVFPPRCGTSPPDKTASSPRRLIGGTLGLSGTAPGARRHLPRASHLQAAIRFAVSACADRRPALADDRRCRGGRGRRLPRCHGSLSAARAGRPSCIGCRSPATRFSAKATPTSADCKACSAWFAPMAAANHWRGRCRRSAASPSPQASRLAVAKPRAVRSQGRGARRRHARSSTPYVYMYDLVVLAVAVGFSHPLRARTRISRERNFRPCRGRRADPELSLRKTQVGLAAALIVMALVVQRALAEPDSLRRHGGGNRLRHSAADRRRQRQSGLPPGNQHVQPTRAAMIARPRSRSRR